MCEAGGLGATTACTGVDVSCCQPQQGCGQPCLAETGPSTAIPWHHGAFGRCPEEAHAAQQKRVHGLTPKQDLVLLGSMHLLLAAVNLQEKAGGPLLSDQTTHKLNHKLNANCFFSCARDSHTVPRHTCSTAEDSRTVIHIAWCEGHGKKSSTQALLLLTEEVTPVPCNKFTNP